jgi:hypothetical protein
VTEEKRIPMMDEDALSYKSTVETLGDTRKVLRPGQYEIRDRVITEMIHNPARGRRPLFSQAWIMMLLDLVGLGWPLYFLNDYYSTVVEYEVKKYIISNDDVPQ